MAQDESRRYPRALPAWTAPPSQDALIAEATAIAEGHDRLKAALEAVLLFHGGGPWDDRKRLRWLQLTGSNEATARVLCDTVRAALVGSAGP